MIKYFLAALCVAAFSLSGPAFALSEYTDPDAKIVIAQATASAPTVVVPPTNDAIVTPDGKGGVTVSVGSAAGQFLIWAYLAFGGIVTVIIVAYVKKLMAHLGIQMTADQEAELSRALQDGLNHAAEAGADLSRNKLTINVDDPLSAAAIQYALSQKGALIKSMGLDPTDGNTVKMLQAKLATLKVDPTVATAVQTEPAVEKAA